MRPSRMHPLRVAFATAVLALGMALAPATPARADNPNIPTEEQIEEYILDGSLDDRIEFQEELDAAPTPEFLSLMGEDESAAPFTWSASMPTTGDARIFAVRVAFPAGEDEEAMGFSEGDTVEALQAIIDGDGDAYPYENVQAYYGRASYGKVNVTGDAFDYTAQHPRSYYDDNDMALFAEVLAAFDEQIDFTDYDGDGDGVIDCVVIHFAGPDTGWGSTWWSCVKHGGIYDDEGVQPTFDDEIVGSRMLLHDPSNTSEGCRTIIHECGHTFGLPDYYQSPKSAARTGGILTFDMMNNNIGDHNGFSKWMLGWLDDAQVTWVTVTEGGVTAVRGGEEVGTPTDDGGLAVDLEPFTGSDASQTGGIIVVADHDFDKYSSYYVLQYDNYAGNQSVYWDADDPKPLSSGFRMYRVQAQLNDYNELVHDNVDDVLHDQLIELVDPDGGEEHRSDTANNVIGSAGSGERWGCMLYEDAAVTPATSPSTNFFESASAGWTGISAEVVRSDADGGTVVFRFDPSGRPTADIELAPADDALLVSGATIVVYANTDVVLKSGALPAITLDNGKEVRVASATADGSVITIKTEADADVLAGANTATVTFEEGAFVVVGGALTSEKSVSVPVGGVPLCQSGDLAGSSYAPSIVSLSTIFEDADGTKFFYQCDSDRPFIGERIYYKNVIDPEDPRKVTKTELSGDEAEAARAYFYAQSFMSETSRADEVKHLIPAGVDLEPYGWLLDAAVHDGKVYVISQTWNDSAKRLAIYSTDGTLVESIELGASGHNFARIAFGPAGTAAITLYAPFYRSDLQQVTYFIGKDLDQLGTLTTNGTGAVQWLPDGRFMSYGWRYDAHMAEGASIADPRFALEYNIVCKLEDPDIDPEPEPDPQPEPEPQPKPEPKPSGGDKPLPATGDPFAWLYGFPAC